MAERIIEAPHLLFYRIETLKAMTLYPSLITDALATVRYPGTGKSIIEMNMLEDDIIGEKHAISGYERMLKCLKNEQVKAIISRILQDEKLHLQMLESILNKFNS